MLCLKPYMLWREHQKIKGQGYQGIGSGSSGDDGEPRLSTTQEMQDEEDGNGHAVAETEEDEHVSQGSLETENDVERKEA
jgi:V-type H+-transporting ATPase subunit a